MEEADCLAGEKTKAMKREDQAALTGMILQG
jgi:hypothetical protein